MDTAILVLLLILGLASHLLKKVVAEVRAGNRDISIRSYWLENPYPTALGIVGAVTGFVLLYDTPELTKLTAWGLGYMCDSAAEMFGDRAMKKVAP